MSKVRKLQLSVDEIVSYLKRTTLPTVLVEGTDDKSVYRYIERKLENLEVDILICGGRDALLEIYSRKAEFLDSKVVFVADKDMWYFTGIPNEYRNEIIFSNGYSLENDIYVKELFEGLLDKEEESEFRRLISELSRWFSFEVTRYKSEGYALCDIHINKIIEGSSLSEEYLQKIGFIEPESALVNQIMSSYQHSLRGKNLFQGILRFLSASKRKSKFSRYNLLELGAKTENALLDRLYEKIEIQLKPAQQSH